MTLLNAKPYLSLAPQSQKEMPSVLQCSFAGVSDIYKHDELNLHEFSPLKENCRNLSTAVGAYDSADRALVMRSRETLLPRQLPGLTL